MKILEKYYLKDNSLFVIDKLSMAYLKSGMKKEAMNFLDECFNKKEINKEECMKFKYKLQLLEKSFNKQRIANNLEEAKNNFNTLLPSIEEDKRDSFVYLVSMILNGKV